MAPKDWLYGRPPSNMSPGQVIFRTGSIGGGIVVEYNSVLTPRGEQLVMKTSEVISGKHYEIGHATLHPGAPNWNNHYPTKKKQG